MRNASRLMLGVVVAVTAWASTSGSVWRTAEGDPPAPDTPQARAFAAVNKLLTTLTTTKEGPVPGTPYKKALAMCKTWANVLGDCTMPLTSSPYAIGPEWKGVVGVYLNDDDEATSDLSVSLLLPDVDRKALREHAASALREIGYAVSDDEEIPWSLSATKKRNRDVWMGVGEGLLEVEISLP
jgi:hypothetical protein